MLVFIPQLEKQCKLFYALINNYGSAFLIYKTSRKPQAFKPGDEWCPERSQVKPGEAEQILT
jgi:hypothetical protein